MPELTTKQARFVQEYLVDGNGAQAAIRAGYSPVCAKVSASRLLTKDNPVRRALQARQAETAARLSLTRDDVVKGLLEAVAQARDQRNPMGMISGLRELGRLLGYYYPGRVNVDVNIAGQVTNDRMNRLSDSELMKIIEAGQPSRV